MTQRVKNKDSYLGIKQKKNRLATVLVLCVLRSGLHGDIDQFLERGHIGDGEVGEHFAVDVDLGELEPVDQAAVGGAADARARVDTGNPETAILALFQLAADIRVRHGLHNLLGCGAVLLALCAIVTFG